MTNEQKIREMTTDELADLIEYPIAVFCCADCKRNPVVGTCSKKDCKEEIKEWLNAEAEKDWYLVRKQRVIEMRKQRM